MSGRCKACDNVLGETEIIWRAEQRTFEDLCKACRGVVSRSHKDLDLLAIDLTDTDAEATATGLIDSADLEYFDDDDD